MKKETFYLICILLALIIILVGCTKTEFIIPSQVPIGKIKGTYETTQHGIVDDKCDDDPTTPYPEIVQIGEFFTVDDGCTGVQLFNGTYVYEDGILTVSNNGNELFTLEVIPLDGNYNKIKMYRCFPWNGGCSFILANRI